MLISLRHSPDTPHQAQQVEAFLAGLLARLKSDQPGVVTPLR